MAGAPRRRGVVTMYDTDRGGGVGTWFFQSVPSKDNKLLKFFPDEDDRRRLKEEVTSQLIRARYQIEDPLYPLVVRAPPGKGGDYILDVFYIRNFQRKNLSPINVTIDVTPLPEAPPPAAPPRAAPADPCDNLLSAGNIVDKSSFRKWALENHPDKGGDQAKFQEMSDCYDKKLKPRFGGRRTAKHRSSKKQTMRGGARKAIGVVRVEIYGRNGNKLDPKRMTDAQADAADVAHMEVVNSIVSFATRVGEWTLPEDDDRVYYRPKEDKYEPYGFLIEYDADKPLPLPKSGRASNGYTVKLVELIEVGPPVKNRPGGRAAAPRHAAAGWPVGAGAGPAPAPARAAPLPAAAPARAAPAPAAAPARASDEEGDPENVDEDPTGGKRKKRRSKTKKHKSHGRKYHTRRR